MRIRNDYLVRVLAVKRKWRAELQTIAQRYLSMETNEEVGKVTYELQLDVANILSLPTIKDIAGPIPCNKPATPVMVHLKKPYTVAYPQQFSWNPVANATYQVRRKIVGKNRRQQYTLNTETTFTID